MTSMWWLLLVPVVLFVVQRSLTMTFLLIGHFRYAQYCRHKQRGLPFRGKDWVQYILREQHAMSLLLWWRLTRTFHDGIRWFKSDHRHVRPVVLTHGFTQNGTNMWGYRRALEARGRPTSAASLGVPFRSIPKYCKALSVAIRHNLVLHGEDLGVDVVCHSMGGLVLRQLLVDEPDLRPLIRNIVTIGSPHEGTAAARGFLVPFPDASQMRRNCEYLRTLPRLVELAPEAKHHCVVAEMDYVVYPQASSLAHGARHVILRQPGHGGLLTSPDAIDAVVDAVDGPGSLAGSPAGFSAPAM